MTTLLNNLIEEWKKNSEYSDVEAVNWEPNQNQVEKCPYGCDIEIYENTPTNWARISKRDVYRQTRICRKHGFARIYVITGPTAMGFNWNPQKK